MEDIYIDVDIKYNDFEDDRFRKEYTYLYIQPAINFSLKYLSNFTPVVLIRKSSSGKTHFDFHYSEDIPYSYRNILAMFIVRALAGDDPLRIYSDLVRLSTRFSYLDPYNNPHEEKVNLKINRLFSKKITSSGEKTASKWHLYFPYRYIMLNEKEGDNE